MPRPRRYYLLALLLAVTLAGCSSPAVLEGSVPIDSTKVFSKTKALGKARPPQKPPD